MIPSTYAELDFLLKSPTLLDHVLQLTKHSSPFGWLNSRAIQGS